jgi:hypothetical protein
MLVDLRPKEINGRRRKEILDRRHYREQKCDPIDTYPISSRAAFASARQP